MKKRNGFVSNSSSISFVLVGKEPMVIPEFDGTVKKDLIVPNDFGGSIEFDRRHEVFDDFGSKLNYLYMQILYQTSSVGTKERLLKTLEEILMESFPIEKIVWNLKPNNLYTYIKEDEDKNYEWGYIDHESVYVDGDEEPNLKDIFSNKEEMKKFLFCPDSYIEQMSD